MTEHPEFPQESPAVKYIVKQVAKIEDTQACGKGYYDSLGKVLSRLDKVDTGTNQLKKVAGDLQSMIDAEIISKSIDSKLDQVNTVMAAKLTVIGISTSNILHDAISNLHKGEVGVIVKLDEEIQRAKSRNDQTFNDIQSLLAKVEKKTFQPWYVIWGYRILTLAIGIGIGKFVLG